MLELIDGRVAEWSIASVLKTDEPKGSVSSNLTSSAIFEQTSAFQALFCCLGRAL
jgi:hypothetical protein